MADMTSKKYRNPTPTVDIIIEPEGLIGQVVLIERRNPPFGWALPGGFVDEGESLSAAAVREAKEETGLDVVLTEQFFTYSAPDRDPRQHTVSTVFLAKAQGMPKAGDDAAKTGIFPLGDLPPLAFDHGTILDDYAKYRTSGTRPPATR